MAKLQQTIFGHTHVCTGTRAIDVHPVGHKIIDPHRMLVQGACQRGPSRVVTQAPQDDFEAVIGTIKTFHPLTGRRAQRPKPCAYPGCDRHQAVITPGHNRAEPNRRHPAQAETLPVTMRRNMVVNQRREMHPLHLLKQERNVVNAFCDDAGDVIHPQSLTQSPIYLQIWTNRESELGASQIPRKARRKRFTDDVFLSHNTKDKPAVRELAERLKQDGLRVWLDEWVIQPGDSIPLKIEQGLEQSRTLILIMSQNAFASEWVTLERHTVLFRDPTNAERRFIPLRLDDAEITDTLKQFAYVDWRQRAPDQMHGC